MKSEQINVLLIDDDEDDFIVARDLLDDVQGTSYAVEWRAAYEGALEEMLRLQHDVCLIDYNLGGRNGVDLLVEATEKGYRGPVIMLTGQDDRETDIRAMNAGAMDYLVKGAFDSPGLERAIRYAVNRKRVEDALLDSKERLELANQQIREGQSLLVQSEKMAAVGQLAAGVAHEFNNIHAIIAGYAELSLQAGSLSERLRKQLSFILDSSHRASTITRHLLSFSASQGSEVKRPEEINTVVENILKIIRSEYESEGIVFKTNLMPVTPATMNIGLISQVVMNLLLNARHAMVDSRDKCITICSGEKGGSAFLSIQDTGCGIEEANLDSVFSPFFTTKGEHAVGDTAMSSIKGTGLGLSVCYNIMKAHGGEITCKSSSGEGAVFTLSLPLSTSAEATAKRKRKPTETISTSDVTGRVLVVDDEPHVQNILKDCLGLQGLEVTSAPSAAEALDLFREKPFAVVITDLQMPNINGVEFLKSLRVIAEDNPPICFVITGRHTAFGMSPDSLKSLGVHKLLRKPFRVREVQRLVCDALRGEQQSSCPA